MKYIFPTLRIILVKRRLFYLFSACLLTCTQSGVVHALTNEQLVNSGLPNYSHDSCGAPDTSSGSIQLTGQNAKDSMIFLVKKGLTPMQAAGIIGNLMQESGINPKSQENGSKSTVPIAGVGFGIAQWTTSGRQAGLLSAAAKAGGVSKVTDLLVQLNYLWDELNSQYSSTVKDLRASTSVAQATTVFEQGYERAGIPRMENRLKYAADAYNSWVKTWSKDASVTTAGGGASNTAGAGGATVDTSLGTGAVACNTSSSAGGACPAADGTAVIGNLAILCQAKRFDKFGYLMGGGHEDPESWMAAFNKKGGFNQPYQEGVSPPDLDCSGIEIVAIWLAFHVKTSFLANPPSMNSYPQQFRHIPMSQARPGDILVHGPVGEGHTEIAVTNGGTQTFGAHTQGIPGPEQISLANYPHGNPFTDAYVYIGPGSDRK